MSAQTALLRTLAFFALAIGPALLCVLLLVLPTGPLRTFVRRYTDHFQRVSV